MPYFIRVLIFIVKLDLLGCVVKRGILVVTTEF